MTKPLTHNEMISAIFAANTEAARLEGELKQVTKERDAARRLACGALATGGWDIFATPDDWSIDRGRDLFMRDFADERNWDCFKQATP